MQPEWEFWLDNQISPVVAKWLSRSAGYKFLLSCKMRLFESDDRRICLMAKKVAISMGFEKIPTQTELSPDQALF